MKEKPILCEAHIVCGDGTTRWACQNTAKYKVGIPHESLVRHYVCADHVFMALHAFNGDAVIFDLETRKVVSPKDIPPVDPFGFELPIPPENKPFGVIVFHFTRLRPYDIPAIKRKIEQALKTHDLTKSFTIRLGWLAYADYQFLGHWPDGCSGRATDSLSIYVRNGHLEEGQ